MFAKQTKFVNKGGDYDELSWAAIKCIMALYKHDSDIHFTVYFSLEESL